MRRTLLLSFSLALCAGCSTVPEGQKSTKPATGPPEIQLQTIEEHASQFDEEEPVRNAGTQQELAASAYIVAHLTDAGYVSRLDAVPVKDLVRSTNVVALPPSGREPQAIVVVAYDSTDHSSPSGVAIALWLEVARALRAVDPDHSVQFVALGAEHTTIGGGHLGSRRLARQLTDDERDPPVLVAVEGMDLGSELVIVAGSERGPLLELAESEGFQTGTGAAGVGPGEVFEAAGFDSAVIGGGAEAAGRVLLAYLSDL